MDAERTIDTGVVTEIATLDRVLRAHAAGLRGLARADLTESGRPAWIAEVERAILEHHKLSASGADSGWLVAPLPMLKR